MVHARLWLGGGGAKQEYEWQGTMIGPPCDTLKDSETVVPSFRRVPAVMDSNRS